MKKAVIKERSNKHKQFDFFYTRTCFRYMNEYYKESYQHFIDHLSKDSKNSNHKSLSHMTKGEVENNLINFIDHIFGKQLLQSSKLSPIEKQQIIQSMMIFVFAHRHTTGDTFISETHKAMEQTDKKDLHFDFSIVRNVMYLYSKKAQEHYMTYPVESFFLAHF